MKSAEKLGQVERKVEELQQTVSKLAEGKVGQSPQKEPTAEPNPLPRPLPTRALFDDLLEGVAEAGSECEPQPVARRNTALVIGAVTTGVLAVLVLLIPASSPWMALVAGVLWMFCIVSGVSAMWHDR